MGFVNGVNLLPSTGEFTYATTARRGQRVTEAVLTGVNFYFAGGPPKTDYSYSIDQLQDAFPACTTVAVVCAWFGNSTDAAACQIYPATTYVNNGSIINPATGLPWPTVPNAFEYWNGSSYTADHWRCSSLDETSAGLIPISTTGGSFTYGGTPSDQSIVECISDLKARGFRVVFYPFILMDAPGKPWRGRITYSPDVSSVATSVVAAFLGSATTSQFTVLVDGLKFKCAAGLEVDQQQITVSARATDTVGGVPFLQALRNGVFDGCEILRERAFLNSWSPADTANPIGSVILFKGRIGTIDNVGRTTAQITVNSDLVLLDLQMPRNVYSPACQHVLYDSGCTLIKSAFGHAGTVGAGSTNSVINWSGATASNFHQGTITFSSGVNAGITANIKSAVAGVSLSLSYPLLNAPGTGDAFTAYWGCDHTQATCTSKFNNLVNFRGFPYIPSPTYAV